MVSFRKGMSKKYEEQFWTELRLWGSPQGKQTVLTHIRAVHDQVFGAWFEPIFSPENFLRVATNKVALREGFAARIPQLPLAVRVLDQSVAVESLYNLYQCLRLRYPEEWGLEPLPPRKTAKDFTAEERAAKTANEKKVAKENKAKKAAKAAAAAAITHMLPRLPPNPPAEHRLRPATVGQGPAFAQRDAQDEVRQLQAEFEDVKAQEAPDEYTVNDITARLLSAEDRLVNMVMPPSAVPPELLMGQWEQESGLVQDNTPDQEEPAGEEGMEENE